MLKVLKTALISMAVFMSAILLVSRLESNPSQDQTILLEKDNLLVLSEPVTDESAHRIMEKAHELDAMQDAVLTKKPIYLFLNTPGGSVEAGTNLAVYLRGLRRPVHTITLFAASMGFHLVENLGIRYGLSNATFMNHHARCGVEGEMGGLSGSQLEKRLGYWKSRLEEMDLIVVARTKGRQSLRSYREAYENELWLTGKEAVYEGYADEVINVRCGDTGGNVEGMRSFFGRAIKVMISSCPLDPSIISADQTIQVGPVPNIPTDLITYNRLHILPLIF